MSTHEQDQRIDYVEFAATDLEALKAFYQSTFGWTFTDYGPRYTSFNDGRLSGGFSTEAKAGSGGPLIVIYASDLQASYARVVANGGQIRQKIFSFPGGRRFQFADPSGNELAVWSE